MGFTAYGQGYYDGELKAARTFTPRLSIANAVADYIAAFGDMPTTVLDGKGKVVWTGRTRHRIVFSAYTRTEQPVLRHTKR